MAKTLVYAANTNAQTVAPGSAVNFGSVTRRVGCGITLSGTTLTFAQSGYYDIDVDTTYTGTAGNVILALEQNGIPVVGATNTETIGTASTEVHSTSIACTIRVYCCLGTAVTFNVLGASTGTPTFSNATIRVTKI